MKKLISLFTTALLAFGILSTASSAHDHKAGDLTIQHPWARATAKSANTGAAYLMISNAGAVDDKLIDAKSNVANKTQIHLSSMKDGIMKMEHVDSVDVPAGGMAELKPGGYHIMFMGLKAPLKADAEFPLTLVFEKSGDVTVNVVVQKGPGMKTMDHSKMKP